MSTETKAIIVGIIAVCMLLPKTGFPGIFGILITGICLIAVWGLVHWFDDIAEKLKSPWISYIMIFIALYGFFQVLAKFPDKNGADSGPCATVAPEDRQDCLDEYYANPTPGISIIYQSKYTPEPLYDPYNSYNDMLSRCPTGCTVHTDGCNIKGNISFDSGEKIYHVPGQEYYDSTMVDPSHGERWFCTEDEAQANGFRRSYK